MPFCDFKANGQRSIPKPPISVLTEFFHAEAETIVQLLPLSWYFKSRSRGVMVKVMDYGIVVSEFKLQSRHYVHFRANSLEKGMNPLILPAIG